MHLLQSQHDIDIDNKNDADDATLSRRRLISQALTSAATASLILTNPSIASAKVVATPSALSAAPAESAATTPERDALFQAIANKSSDDVVAKAIEQLLPLSPMKGDTTDSASYASGLDGEWKLLWYNKSDFSPLLKLPSPFRPDSYQYFGTIAEQEVGEGRVAQGLTGGILSALGPQKELWLSSGAVGQEGHPSTLEIFPPFRFQLGELPGSTTEKQTIVESESDADFRGANGRTVEAQLAPKNEYEQLYLENLGSGSLRVSMVTKGDPVIVGDMFVHQKL